MADERITRIYVLRDPRDNSIRYVGKTTSPLAVRLKNHLQQAKRVKTHCAAWIRSLATLGAAPAIALIEEAGDDWAARESYWIERLRGEGHALTNHAGGGQGPAGHKRTPEQIARTAEAVREAWKDPVARAARIASQKAAQRPAPTSEAKDKRTASLRSEAVRRGISQSIKALWADPAYRSAMLAARKAGQKAA